MATFLELFIKFMSGDLIWVVTGSVFTLAGWLLAKLFRAEWLRIVAGILLVVAGIAGAHALCESLTAWWTTPLGPALHVVR